MTAEEFTTWKTQAACADYDPDMWYPETDPPDVVTAGMAKHICSTCPVRNDCLLHALQNDENIGIWGGMTPAERGRLLAFGEDSRARILSQKTHPRLANIRDADARRRSYRSGRGTVAPANEGIR